MTVVRGYEPRALGAQCDRCPLNDRDPVPPERARGDRPRLVIVGMNPGSLEENLARPFVGPSGRLLDACLDEAGVDRAECHITNAALCKGDDQQLKRAVPCCAPRLAAELAPLEGVPILALGAESLRPILGKGAIMKTRGFLWVTPEIKDGSIKNCERNVANRIKKKADREKIEAARDSLAIQAARKLIPGRVVIPSVHPAMILRGADGWLPVLRIDIRRAARLVASGGKLKREDVVPFTRTNDPALARRLLAGMGELVNIDIETDGNEPMVVPITCVGVCDVAHIEAYVAGRVGSIDPSKVVILDPWVPRLVPVLRDFLKNRTALTHNGPAYDEIVLGRFGVKYPRRHDTLIAHYSFASDKPKSLAFVSSIYNDTTPWKVRFKQGDEEKGVAGFGVKKEDLAAYNAADVVCGSLAWVRMQSDLNRERRVYEHDLKHALLCQKMQVNGLLVDQKRREELSLKLRRRRAALLGAMRQLLGRKSFSPSKPNDVRKALFDELRTPIYMARFTPTGLTAVNAELFERLKQGENRAAKLAGMIVDYRRASDIKSEYLDNLFIAADGRVHAHWRSYGTVSGRPATHKPNILNIPRVQFCRGCGEALIDGMKHRDEFLVVPEAWSKGHPIPPGTKRHKEFEGAIRSPSAEAELKPGTKIISITCKDKCRGKGQPQPEAEYQGRDIYIAAPGHVFIYFDLSQAEMRFAANISGDEAFIAACVGDVHAGNARVLFRNVPGALKDLEDPKGAGKRLRDIAKNCGFAITYCAEADKLHTHLVEHGFGEFVTLDLCQDAIDNIRGTYWRYFQYVDENVRLCQRQGFLRTAFLGRKRWLGKLPKPTDVSNFPIQSGVADVMNERLAILDDRLPRETKHVVYQYDSSIYEVPEGLAGEVKGIIRDVWSEPVIVPANGRVFPQPIDLKEGRRWSDFG